MMNNSKKEKAITGKEKREKHYLILLGIGCLFILIFIALHTIKLGEHNITLHNLSGRVDINAMNDEINVKYLMQNDGVILEELLDQSERLEIIETQLGITKIIDTERLS